jgi:S1-C subfamily serine protease
MAARRRYEDEDEDRPRRRPRGRERDEDEDDWPPPEKPSGDHTLLIVLALVGGGGLLFVLLCAGLFIFAFRSAPPPAAGDPQPQVAVLPPQAQVPAGPAPAQMDPATVARVKGSTVYLRVQLPNGDVAEGSGFLCLEPGIIVTNAHVLGMLRADAAPPRTVDVVVHSGEANELKTTGSVLAVDRSNDLAVLRAAADAARLPPPLPVDSAENLIETQKVYVFGFPFGAGLGKNISVSESSVSSLRRQAGVLDRVQVNGGMNPGNSGGPVTDARGAVVGVSVSIIRGTQINFAIPGDFVQLLLAGKFADNEPGLLYRADGRLMLPLKLACLDPLGRIRSARVEVWAGIQGAARPSAAQAPPAQPGDGPAQSYPLAPAAGGYAADVPFPQLQPGQVCWVRPVFVNSAGATRWGTAAPVTPDVQLTLERKPAAVQFKPPTGPVERSLKMSSTLTANVYQGRASAAVMTYKLEGDVLESLSPDVRGIGTLARLTIGKCSYARETPEKKEGVAAEAYALLSQFSPTFLVVANHSITERGRRNFAVLRPQYQAPVERMFNMVCNVFEVTTIPLPNRAVRPGETWPARLPMFVIVDKKAQIQELHLTCTYEGTRSADGRNEAYIGLSGVVKGRAPRAEELGQVKGQALFDVDKGFLTLVKLAVNSELEDEEQGVRILVSKESVVRRSEGNTLGITPATVNQPGAK